MPTIIIIIFIIIIIIIIMRLVIEISTTLNKLARKSARLCAILEVWFD